MTKCGSAIKGSCSWVTIPLLAGIAMAAITQNIYVGFAGFMVAFIYGIVSYVSLIPLAGVVIQYYLLSGPVSAWALATFTIPQNVMWIIGAVFWINIVMGFIVTILTTIIGLIYIISNR